MPGADIDFAKAFLEGRVAGHRKDVLICLKAHKLPSGKSTHACFPALMITLGFADLLAGLAAGKIKHHGLVELQTYFDNFMDRAKYSRDAINVLYEALRHKIAHLGHPYIVFDTRTAPKVFPSPPHYRYVWTVGKLERPRPLEIEHFATPRLAEKHTPPWDVSYDSRVTISVKSLSKDLSHSVFKPGGYFARLQADSVALTRFQACMELFYPR